MNLFSSEFTNTIWAAETQFVAGFLNQVDAIPQGSAGGGYVPAPVMQKTGDTAIISVRGMLLKTVPGAFRAWGLNVTGYKEIVQQIDAAVSDAEVKRITLSIESPGGMVAGSQECAEAIAAANRSKPVTAVIDDICASGAYLLASQAGKIESNRNAIIGSVGVYSVFYDYSKQAENEGIRAVVIASGPHKGMGIVGTQITEEQIAAYKTVIDGMAEHFKEAVQAGRKIDKQTLSIISDGRVWLAPKAQSLGLVDVVTGKTTVSKKGTLIMEKNFIELSQARAAEKGITLGQAMGQISAEQPEVHAAFLSRSKDGAPPVKTSGRTGHDFIDEAKLIANQCNIKLGDAMRRVAAEQPELYKKYIGECQKARSPLDN